MKIGTEVEGIHKGVMMIFCQAYDVIQRPNEVLNCLLTKSVRHLYVSDNDNLLDYEEVGDLFSGAQVTMDVTKVTGNRPANVNIMLRIEAFDEVSQLNSRDQVKFERDRNVIVFHRLNAMTTKPEDFAGDIEL